MDILCWSNRNINHGEQYIPKHYKDIIQPKPKTENKDEMEFYRKSYEMDFHLWVISQPEQHDILSRIPRWH